MSAIEFADVGKRYGDVRALDQVSFAVAKGEMFGVIGPDGAGKTTAIRLACGLLRPESGRITVLGRDPVREHRAVTHAVGYLSQRFSLYGDLTIDENIAFFAEIHGVRRYGPARDRLLAMTQLTSFPRPPRPVPIPVYAEMSSIDPVFVLLVRAGTARSSRRLHRIERYDRRGDVDQPGCVRGDGPGADDFVDAAADASAAEPGADALRGPRLVVRRGLGPTVEKDSVDRGRARYRRRVGRLSGVPRLFVTTAEEFLADHRLQEEVFGPASLIVRVADVARLAAIVDRLEGQLTATVHATPTDYADAGPLLERLELITGRVLFNGWPTGVEVGHAVVHGGPFLATSAPSTTSVGSLAIELLFLRPVAYQNVPEELLADEVRTDNPLRIWRRVDGALQQT